MSPILKHIKNNTQLKAYLEWEYIDGLSEELRLKDGSESILNIFAKPNKIHIMVWDGKDTRKIRKETFFLADPELFDKIDRTIQITMQVIT